MSNEAAAPLTYTLPEAAELLGMHRVTLWRKAKAGTLPVPVLDFGGAKRVSRAALEHYIATGSPTTVTPETGEPRPADGALQRDGHQSSAEGVTRPRPAASSASTSEAPFLSVSHPASDTPPPLGTAPQKRGRARTSPTHTN